MRFIHRLCCSPDDLSDRDLVQHPTLSALLTKLFTPTVSQHMIKLFISTGSYNLKLKRKKGVSEVKRKTF